MKVLTTLILLLSTSLTPVVYGVNVADDTAGTGVCSSSSSSSDNVDGACSEPELSEPTNDAIVSPMNDADDFDENDGEYDDEMEEGGGEFEDDEFDDEEDEDEFSFECTDNDEKCSTYAASGACTDNPGYMTYHCASSCDTCETVKEVQKAAQFVKEGTNSKPCMDDNYECLEWAGMGECDANPG